MSRKPLTAEDLIAEMEKTLAEFVADPEKFTDDFFGGPEERRAFFDELYEQHPESEGSDDV
jgi:hypothetical protein